MSDEPVKITTASRRCTTHSHNVSAVWRSWHLCLSCLEFLHHIIAKKCENLGDSSKVVWLLLSQKAGCDSNLKTTLERCWNSISDQLSADKMTCTPVLSDLLLLEQSFWMLTHQQRGSFFVPWWKHVYGPSQVLVSELTFPMLTEGVITAGNVVPVFLITALQPGGQEMLKNRPDWVSKPNNPEYYLHQVKAEYKADVSECSLQVTTSSLPRLFRRFLGQKRFRHGQYSCQSVSQSLIQLLVQHNSWLQPLRSLILGLTWTIQKSRLPQLLFKEAESNSAEQLESFW